MELGPPRPASRFDETQPRRGWCRHGSVRGRARREMVKVLNGGTRWRTGAGEDGNRRMSRSGEMRPKSHFWAFLRVVKVEKLWFDPFFF